MLIIGWNYSNGLAVQRSGLRSHSNGLGDYPTIHR